MNPANHTNGLEQPLPTPNSMSELNQPTPRCQRALDQLCGWSAVALLFAAPVSRSLFLVASLVYIVAWIATGEFRSKLVFVRTLPVAAPLVLLAGIVALWAAFSPAPAGDIVNNLKVYSKLLLVLMLAVTFSNPVWRARAWWAFTLSMIIVLASTYANVFVNLPWSKTQNQGIGADHSVFVEYVSQSVMTAIFFAMALNKALCNPNRKSRFAWVLVAVVAAGSVLFLLQGRSGLVALMVVILTFLALYARGARRWSVALGVALLGITLITSSPLMRDRLTTAHQEISAYQPSDRTSLGLRITMWKLALDKMVEHPVTGTGSGTYHQIAAQHFGYCDFTCTHPHNQYLFFGMEYGLIGLFAYLWLLWRLLATARRSVSSERAVLYALVAVLAVDSLFNVPLWYRAQSYFFYVMLGLLVASNLPVTCQRVAASFRFSKPAA